MSKNVECTRCGYRWDSEQYNERKILPHYCPRCYREDVQPIPEEPTVIERKVSEVKQKAEEVPRKIEAIEKDIVLWKENNRYLIDMAVFAFSLGVIFVVLYMFIFVWG